METSLEGGLMTTRKRIRISQVLPDNWMIEIRERAGVRSKSSAMINHPTTSTSHCGSVLGWTYFVASYTRLLDASMSFLCSTSRPKSVSSSHMRSPTLLVGTGIRKTRLQPMEPPIAWLTVHFLAFKAMLRPQTITSLVMPPGPAQNELVVKK